MAQLTEKRSDSGTSSAHNTAPLCKQPTHPVFQRCPRNISQHLPVTRHHRGEIAAFLRTPHTFALSLCLFFSVVSPFPGCFGISWEFGSLYIHTLFSSIYFAIAIDLAYLALIRASASCTVHIVISWKSMDLHIRCSAFHNQSLNIYIYDKVQLPLQRQHSSRELEVVWGIFF